MTIKIAIADDHPLVIKGLHHILNNSPHMTITGSYANGPDLMNGLAAALPDVLLLDIQMPGRTGEELAPEIQKKYPSVKMLALTNHDDLYYIKSMLSKGVKGYLLKTTGEEVLLNAINTVFSNNTYIDPYLAEKLAQQNEHDQTDTETIPILTKREKEVLAHIAANLTSQEIADTMFLSKRTVDSHRQSLLTKMGAKNTAALLQKAIQLGLLA